MATAQYVTELAQGTKVDGAYVLRTKELRVARTGDAFLSIVLADRTGSIPAVLFRPSRVSVEIPVGAVVAVKGTVTSFKGARRVSVEQLVPATSWNPENLLAVGNRPTEELVEEFTAFVRLVGNTALRQLLRALFGDKALFRRFSECPATQSGHHCFLGGLLEHTVMVAGICVELTRQYESLDRDILLTAALVHDVGVLDELRFETAITSTDEGRLVGHAALGAFRVHDTARKVGLDEDVRSKIEHAVLCHHGHDSRGEHPMTLEALALQHADGIDSQMTGFSDALHGAVRAEEAWTDDQNPFRRQLHVGRRERGPIGVDHGSGSEPARRLA